MNQRQKATSLKYLLNEVMDGKKLGNRVSNRSMNFSSLDEVTLDAMLSSGFFTVNESTAVSVIFKSSNTNVINESTISKIDSVVNRIVEALDSNEILAEGFFGDIWDGLKKLGNKAKDAVAGGWSKLKAIWGEFKELIQELMDHIRQGLSKLLDAGKQYAEDEYNALKDQAMKTWNASMKKFDDINKKKQLSDDIVNMYKTGEWVTTKFKSLATSAQAAWFKDPVAGKGTPEETETLDQDDVQAGFEDLKQEEGTLTKANLIRERLSLLSNKEVLRELYRFSIKRLNEGGGGGAHLEDAVSNPVLKKIIKTGINLLQWALIPFAKAAQTIVTQKAVELFKGLSGACKMFGGPGVYAFEAIALIIGEIVEIKVKEMTGDWISPAKLGLKLIKYLIPPLAVFITSAEKLLKALKLFLFIWTLGTILFNLVLSARKAYTDYQEKKKSKEGGEETGGEPEVQTAGYKPNGEFKIKEGKLVFVS